MISYNTMIVLVGTGLLGANAALVGSFAVLRGRALTGDALAHAALPGLCIAFLLVGERSLPMMLLGALASGVIGVSIISALRRYTRVKEDAAIGIVLSVFFGAGIALSGFIQGSVADGSKAGLDSYILGRTAGMIAQDVAIIAGVSLVCLVSVLIVYKEFKLVLFDPEFARVMGLPALALDLFLMVMIAVTVVVGLPAVGVVLIAALLILPGAAARFWTERLGRMLLVAGCFGLSVGVIGTAVSAQFSKLPAGPVIVLVGTAILLASVLFAPRRGGVARLLSHFRFRRTIARRTLMRTLYELAEPHFPQRRPVHVNELLARRSWTERSLQRLIDNADDDGLLVRDAKGGCLLTDDGLVHAAEVVRCQRIWDRFLDEYADQAATVGDPNTDSPDDFLPPRVLAELEAKLRGENRLPDFEAFCGAKEAR